MLVLKEKIKGASGNLEGFACQIPFIFLPDFAQDRRSRKV
jgi:hypothetical protein